MELDFINGLINLHMKANGQIIFYMDMENIFIQMVQFIKVHGVIIEWMD